VSVFQCVANNHCCDGKKTECGKHIHGPDSVRSNHIGQENEHSMDGWRNIPISAY
jgi:hypothetical protein